jgi:hypothetical protein
MTHGLVDGAAATPVAILNRDDPLATMSVVADRQVNQLTLGSNSRTYGPWGDLSQMRQTITSGAIVGFFGCNKDGYITGIGVWKKDTQANLSMPLSKSG